MNQATDSPKRKVILIAHRDDFESISRPTDLVTLLENEIRFGARFSERDECRTKWGAAPEFEAFTDADAPLEATDVLAMRLSTSSKEKGGAAWYLKKFHHWRSQSPARGLRDNESLANPFRRGFRHLLGHWTEPRFSVGKDFHLDSFNDWTLLSHYEKQEFPAIEKTDPVKCRFELIGEILRHCPKELAEAEKRTALEKNWKEPDVICILEDRVYDEFNEMKALFQELGLEPQKLGNERSVRLPVRSSEPALKLELRFRANLERKTFDEARERGWVCVAHQKWEPHFRQTARGSVSSGRVRNQLTTARKEPYWVLIRDDADGPLQTKSSYLSAPRNFFVVWDSIWEAAYRTRGGTNSAGPSNTETGTDSPKRSGSSSGLFGWWR